MLQLTWLFLAVVALVTTAGAMRSGYDTATRLIAGAFGMVLWGFWGYGAFDVLVISNGIQFTESYPQLAYVGFVAAIVMFLFVVRLAFALVQDDNQSNPENLDPMEGM